MSEIKKGSKVKVLDNYVGRFLGIAGREATVLSTNGDPDYDNSGFIESSDNGGCIIDIPFMFSDTSWISKDDLKVID